MVDSSTTAKSVDSTGRALTPRARKNVRASLVNCIFDV